MRLFELYKYISNGLSSLGRENAGGEAVMLLEHSCGLDFTQYLANQRAEAPADAVTTVDSVLNKLQKGMPFQYALGYAWFYGLKLRVNENVLIPRSDTELLAERSIAALNSSPSKRFLDLCCGSGAVGLAVKSELPDTKVVSTDISEGALEVSRRNALQLGFEVEYRQGNLFEAVSGQKFDVIASNPPYITADEMAELDKEVQEFEPELALYGGLDGLDFYRRISCEAPTYLNRGGTLLFEVGWRQADAVCELMRSAGFTDIKKYKDMAGIERVTEGRLK